MANDPVKQASTLGTSKKLAGDFGVTLEIAGSSQRLQPQVAEDKQFRGHSVHGTLSVGLQCVNGRGRFGVLGDRLSEVTQKPFLGPGSVSLQCRR